MKPEYVAWIEQYVSRQTDGFVRGKCTEATLEMVAAFPELKRVAGFAHCTWGADQHWWCVAPDGTVVDPTKAQFEFGLVFEYEEVDLSDPATRARIPTGACPNCGGDTYNGRTVCSDACGRAYVAYLNACY